MLIQLFEPLREWVIKLVGARARKSLRHDAESKVTRWFRSGPHRFGTGRRRDQNSPRTSEFIQEHGSPSASWFYIKQLTEPSSTDVEFISTRQIQTMTKNKSYIAVDIAKDSLQVQASDYACALNYDKKGLKKLLSILQKQPEGTILVCEATGGYERMLLSFLTERELPYVLLNPGRVRDFSRSEGVKAKTDPIDARMLLRYAQQRQPEATKPPAPSRRELSVLMDRRSQLTEMLAREKTRLQKSEALVQSDIERMIEFMESELQAVEERIRHTVRSDEELSEHSKIMQSVSGVGPVTAWSICAYLSEITQVNRAEVAALAGLAPYNQDSGKKTGTRKIQGGRQKVRNPLYMAATSAATHNPHIKAYVDRLRFEKGKPYKWAMTAAMRKMLIHIQSLLKNHQKQLA